MYQFGLIIPFPIWRFKNMDAVKFSLSFSSLLQDPSSLCLQFSGGMGFKKMVETGI